MHGLLGSYTVPRGVDHAWTTLHVIAAAIIIFISIIFTAEIVAF
jgi:hypothetical protein